MMIPVSNSYELENRFLIDFDAEYEYRLRLSTNLSRPTWFERKLDGSRLAALERQRFLEFRCQHVIELKPQHAKQPRLRVAIGAVGYLR